jgi:hypothetical protein
MKASPSSDFQIVSGPDMRPIGGRLVAEQPTADGKDYRSYLSESFYVPTSSSFVYSLLIKTQFSSDILPRMAPTDALLLLDASRTAPRSFEQFKPWLESLLTFWRQPEHGCPPEVVETVTSVIEGLDADELVMLGNQLTKFHTGGPLEEFRPRNPVFNSRVLHVYAELPDDALGNSDIHPDDRNVPGLYAVTVPADLSDVQAANCALAGFHSEVPIKQMFRFTTLVVDPETDEILKTDTQIKYYALRNKCRDVTLRSRFHSSGRGFPGGDEDNEDC